MDHNRIQRITLEDLDSSHHAEICLLGLVEEKLSFTQYTLAFDNCDRTLRNVFVVGPFTLAYSRISFCVQWTLCE